MATVITHYMGELQMERTGPKGFQVDAWADNDPNNNLGGYIIEIENRYNEIVVAVLNKEEKRALLDHLLLDHYLNDVV